jgi:nitroimidazol reductase NimA-like FMN-containing flavoprotein (pyridoxamine 5'-phosphate oxidase superfamily)
METNFKNPNIAAFLKRNHIAVLATADKTTAVPHAATIYYGTDSQMNIYFITKVKTKKAENIRSNPAVALTVYEANTQSTLQVTGTATEVLDPQIKAKALKLMSKYSKETAGTEQTPISRLYAGDEVLYKLWPQTIRLGEYKYGPANAIFDTATPAEELLE